MAATTGKLILNSSMPNPGTSPNAARLLDFRDVGDQRRGSIYGPGSRNIDIAIARLFRVADTHRIEARLESFNFLNWTRYGNPGANLNAPNTFGRITNAADARVMQFALKYSF